MRILSFRAVVASGYASVVGTEDNTGDDEISILSVTGYLSRVFVM